MNEPIGGILYLPSNDPILSLTLLDRSLILDFVMTALLLFALVSG
jgi:hypothetical protein